MGGQTMFRRFLDLFKKKDTEAEKIKRQGDKIFKKLVQLLSNVTEYASDKEPEDMEQDMGDFGG
jgi:hypothetical protein